MTMDLLHVYMYKYSDALYHGQMHQNEVIAILSNTTMTQIQQPMSMFLCVAQPFLALTT